jgi:hypothetical protein
MVRQFLSGFPGLQEADSRFWIENLSDGFEDEMTSFYENYMEVEEDLSSLHNSRFSLTDETARGFSSFINYLSQQPHTFVTLKGQVTGPVTIGVGVKDQKGRSIIYDDNLRDVLIKLVKLKGRWQVEALRPFTPVIDPIIFIDEPGAVSFGSSAFMGISREMVSGAIAEVISGIHASRGMAGVHICANGDWGPVLSSNADIISFDAYFYFDNFILFKDKLIDFLHRGGVLAWGIVPTGDPQLLKKIDSESLWAIWQQQLDILASFGFSKKQLMQQTFIAPSCGTGSLPRNLAIKVLRLTREVSAKAQVLLENC